MAGTLRIGRVGEHAEHALVADAGDSGKIRGLSVDRRLIELEITGVENGPDRCAQRERTCAGRPND